MAAGGINVSADVERSVDVTWSVDDVNTPGIKVGRWVATAAAHSDAAATAAADCDDDVGGRWNAAAAAAVLI